MAATELLRQAFAARAERGELRASAVIQDLMLIEEGAERRADAISIEIEHFTGYNVTMIVRYKRLDGRIAVETPFRRRWGPSHLPAASDIACASDHAPERPVSLGRPCSRSIRFHFFFLGRPLGLARGSISAGQ